MSDTWTIGELAEHAARALRDGAPPPANGRVRDVPGERLIRWYTTIGLVDPPLTRRGRIARYGRRHLLQLVAVKRLQAAGRSIAEIQAALAGAPDHVLESAARLMDVPAAGGPLAGGIGPLPDGKSPAPGGSSAGQAQAGEPVRGRFWADRPGGAAALARESGADHAVQRGGPAQGAPNATAPSPAATSQADGPAAGRAVSGDESRVITGIRLGDGVRLVLDAGRAPSEEDVQAVLAAARPLLAVLEERKLT